MNGYTNEIIVIDGYLKKDTDTMDSNETRNKSNVDLLYQVYSQRINIRMNIPMHYNWLKIIKFFKIYFTFAIYLAHL